MLLFARTGGRVLALVCVVGCHGAASPAESVVVTPAATATLLVEEGRVRPTGRARGCLGVAEIDAMVGPLTAALNKVAPTAWEGRRDDEGRIVLLPRRFRVQDARELAALLDATQPFAGEGAAFGSIVSTGLPGSARARYCQELSLRGAATRTRQGACVVTQNDEVEEVKVDFSRRFEVFAPLLRVSEVEARRIAIAHAEKKFRRDVILFHSALLLAECDATLAASSLVYLIDLVSDGKADIVEVDATSGAVRSSRALDL